MYDDRTYSFLENPKHIIIKALKKKGYKDGSIRFLAPLSAGVTGWYLVVGEKPPIYLGYNIEQALSGVARLKPIAG